MSGSHWPSELGSFEIEICLEQALEAELAGSWACCAFDVACSNWGLMLTETRTEGETGHCRAEAGVTMDCPRARHPAAAGVAEFPSDGSTGAVVGDAALRRVGPGAWLELPVASEEFGQSARSRSCWPLGEPPYLLDVPGTGTSNVAVSETYGLGSS